MLDVFDNNNLSLSDDSSSSSEDNMEFHPAPISKIQIGRIKPKPIESVVNPSSLRNSTENTRQQNIKRILGDEAESSVTKLHLMYRTRSQVVTLNSSPERNTLEPNLPTVY